MDPKIAARFSDSILQAAMQRYEIAPEAIRLLDGFESFIYEFDRPDGEFILRLGHSLRRTPDLVRGEVDWINYLAKGGVGVARAVLSSQGNLVEEIPDGQGDEFLCTAFVKARGRIAGKEQINERLFLNYGILMGRMHALAKLYRPSKPGWRRYEWDAPENNPYFYLLPEGETVIRKKYMLVFEYLQTLPRDPLGYGMIHQDAHTGNLFVDDDYTLTLFDFDDCIYGHFIYDIAMVLFYIVGWGGEDRAGFTRRFMSTFFKGYRTFNDLDPRWLAELPHFLKLREIDLFSAILTTMGETPEDAWCARYMQGRRARIDGDVPFIEFDWGSLGEYL